MKDLFEKYEKVIEEQKEIAELKNSTQERIDGLMAKLRIPPDNEVARQELEDKLVGQRKFLDTLEADLKEKEKKAKGIVQKIRSEVSGKLDEKISESMKDLTDTELKIDGLISEVNRLKLHCNDIRDVINDLQNTKAGLANYDVPRLKGIIKEFKL